MKVDAKAYMRQRLSRVFSVPQYKDKEEATEMMRHQQIAVDIFFSFNQNQQWHNSKKNC